MPRKPKIFISVVLLLSTIGIIVGVYWSDIKSHIRGYETVTIGSGRNVDVSKKTLSPIPPSTPLDRIGIFVGYGQSNSDCCALPGTTLLHPTKVHEYYEGEVYGYSEPMLNSVCLGGCVWGKVADRLVEEGVYDEVLVATAGWPGAPISWLTKGGFSDGYETLNSTVNGMLGLYGKVDGVLYHQGESDNGVYGGGESRGGWGEKFKSIVEDIKADTGADVQFWVSKTSYCGTNPVDTVLGGIQFGLADDNEGIERGVDTDSMIEDVYRYDSCHFSLEGVEKVGVMWADAIMDGL